MRLCKWGACGLSIAIFASVVARHGWAQSPYRMEGIVTDAETKQPVPGVKASVLIESEKDPEQCVRTSTTDNQGRYSITVPAGHGWAWTLQPPAGYCPIQANGTEQFATTAEQPLFTKNYQVRKGFTINFAVRSSEGQPLLPHMLVSLSQQLGGEYLGGFCELDRDGVGAITLPEIEGKYELACGDMQAKLTSPKGMSIEFAKGFDPSLVNDAVRQDGETKIVHDANGHSATLRGCDVTVKGRKMVVTIEVTKAGAQNQSGEIRGRLVNVQGQGIASGLITLAFHTDSAGSCSSTNTTTTDEQGHFAIKVPKLDQNQKVALVITCDGYAGMDTKPIGQAKFEAGIADVGSIKMQPGASVPIRAVGPDGAPLHGAIVEPGNDYASRSRIARTDAKGECRLTNLAQGVSRVTARFGKLNSSSKIPLDSGENELVVLKLSPIPTAPTSAPPERPSPIAQGAVAPEWKIAEWTDGKNRKLSDYRGRVVVLDFWGIWCGPCVASIPAMKQLHDRYQDKEVVFLAIHTAGTEISLVKRLLKQQEWDVAVGLDAGVDIVTGTTVQSYGVQGFPGVIIVDRNGKIAFSSEVGPKEEDVILREMEAIAKTAGLPWPLDEKADEEQLKEQMTKLQVAMFGQKIDEALKVAAEPNK